MYFKAKYHWLTESLTFDGFFKTTEQMIVKKFNPRWYSFLLGRKCALRNRFKNSAGLGEPVL